MHSQVTIQIDFSFKGETYHPSLQLDLDSLMREYGRLPDLHVLLATRNQIDTYSYLYEVMCAHEIHFQDAAGLADRHVINGQFDMAGFEQAWREQQQLSQLADIAQQYMGIADLSQQPGLQQTLMAAFCLGKEQREL